jgi:hypothetical protein
MHTAIITKLIMSNFFATMIQHLRQFEEVVLYAYLPQIRDFDLREADALLAKEYAMEALEYPSEVPAYDAKAAIWAAKVVFNAAQLLLYREQAVKDILPLFGAYTGRKTPGAILSADLTLRFLPDILEKIKAIDEEDVLNSLLENVLQTWHYSGIQYNLDPAGLSLTGITDNPCMFQMYINRIIACQNLRLARIPVLQEGVRAAMGNYGATFWKTFYTELYEPNR